MSIFTFVSRGSSQIGKGTVTCVSVCVYICFQESRLAGFASLRQWIPHYAEATCLTLTSSILSIGSFKGITIQIVFTIQLSEVLELQS